MCQDKFQENANIHLINFVSHCVYAYNYIFILPPLSRYTFKYNKRKKKSEEERHRNYQR